MCMDGNSVADRMHVPSQLIARDPNIVHCRKDKEIPESVFCYGVPMHVLCCDVHTVCMYCSLYKNFPKPILWELVRHISDFFPHHHCSYRS